MFGRVDPRAEQYDSDVIRLFILARLREKALTSKGSSFLSLFFSFLRLFLFFFSSSIQALEYPHLLPGILTTLIFELRTPRFLFFSILVEKTKTAFGKLHNQTMWPFFELFCQWIQEISKLEFPPNKALKELTALMDQQVSDLLTGSQVGSVLPSFVLIEISPLSGYGFHHGMYRHGGLNLSWKLDPRR